MMPRAFIGIGSNIEPTRNIREALRLLARKVQVVDVSTFYRSRPLMHPEQPDFYNGVVAVDTELTPTDLKYRVLRGIEQQLGRVRTADKYAARTIDLDLLLYGRRVLALGGLVLPHPDVFQRAFIAKPLSELCPQLILPGTHRSIQSIVASLPASDMEPLQEFTRELREEIAGAQYAHGIQSR